MSIRDILAAQLGDSFDPAKLDTMVAAAEAENKTALDNEVKGLKANQSKALDQIALLKGNQMPDGFDQAAFDTYNKDKLKFEAEQVKLEEKRLQDEGQWESLKTQLLDKNKLNIDTLTSEKDSEIGLLRSSLDKELIENAAIKAIEAEKGNSFFLLPHMKQNIKTVLGETGYSVQVLDSEGNVRMDDDGKNFTVKQLVAEMKTKDVYAPAFPNMNSGSGQGINTGGQGGGTVNPWSAKTKNITHQAKMMKENPTLAVQMKKAAGVA